MIDQATMLRQMMELEPPTAAEPDSSVPVIVIGSGKGGVGKSVCASVVAAALAEGGARTLLVDGDQNLANLHLLLGAPPTVGLERVLYGEVDPADLIRPVAPSLWLLPGESGAESLHGLGSVDRARLHHRLTGVFSGFDSVVVDSGAGVESVLRVATMNPSTLVVVTVPEPAAITDAYALIKLAHYQAPSLDVGVLVNRCLNESEGPATFDKLSEAAERFLGMNVDLFGVLPEDLAVLRAVRTPGSLLEEHADSPALTVLRRITGDRLKPAAVAPDVQGLVTTNAV